ncbi:hypothetical protein R1sor_001400 [Riccia sorocarpa]|uniref:Ubiquitin-like protease family profile domain-containing protein n=1 Tax=Riccia sorocarpa TaxID=122646 RepID=A0ABD3GWP6_9MARC
MRRSKIRFKKRERELKEQIETLEAKNAELHRQLREARDALADAMVGRRESSEPNHAAGPSIDPVEISNDHDDKKGAETHEPTIASTALGFTKRGAKKPRQRDSASKSVDHLAVSCKTIHQTEKDGQRGSYQHIHGGNIQPIAPDPDKVSLSFNLLVTKSGKFRLLGNSGFLVEMEAAKKWILPSPVMDWAEVPYMFIPIHGYLHWSLIVVRIFTITPSHRQVNTYDCGVHVMALTRSLIQLDDKLGWKLAKNDIKDLVKVADVKQLRNEILAKVSGA